MTTLRTVVSSVAKSLFSAKTSLLLNRFIKVDFPTLVYPTRATRVSLPRFLRWIVFCLSHPANFCLSSEIFCLTMRRSVSICSSPGPRIPIPPRWRSRCVHMPVSLGSRYWYCASSTCILALAVWARLAKMSRMRLVRSSTFTRNTFSIFDTCLGLRSSSKIARLMSLASMYWAISSSLPFPTKVVRLGASHFCVNFFIVIAPAVSARKSSSSRYSLARASFCSGVMSPTSTALSSSTVLTLRRFWSSSNPIY